MATLNIATSCWKRAGDQEPRLGICRPTHIGA